MARILPIEPEHASGYRDALGEVARERSFIQLLEPLPLETAQRIVREHVENGVPHLVALDGDRVVGWCNVKPCRQAGRTHAGVLGMGVVRSHRGQGIGSELLAATLECAFAVGLQRVELEVFMGNEAAVGLYERFGFQREGVKRRARYLDGVWDDVVVMGLLPGGCAAGCPPADEAR